MQTTKPTLTVTDLAVKWDPYISGQAAKHGLKGEDLDDFKQQLYLEFMEGKYDQIFDPAKGAEMTFIFHFVNRRLRQFHTRRKRDYLWGAADVDFMGPEEALTEQKTEDVDRRIDLTEALGMVRERLKDIPARSIAKGTQIERSAIKAFDLLWEGYTRPEIARKMEYSPASVAILVDQIRQAAAEVGLKQFKLGA